MGRPRLHPEGHTVHPIGRPHAGRVSGAKSTGHNPSPFGATGRVGGRLVGDGSKRTSVVLPGVELLGICFGHPKTGFRAYKPALYNWLSCVSLIYGEREGIK